MFMIFFWQMHPLGLCNDDDDDLYEQETGWVGVVKLESSDVDMPPCLTLYQKVSLLSVGFVCFLLFLVAALHLLCYWAASR